MFFCSAFFFLGGWGLVGFFIVCVCFFLGWLDFIKSWLMGGLGPGGGLDSEKIP